MDGANGITRSNEKRSETLDGPCLPGGAPRGLGCTADVAMSSVSVNPTGLSSQSSQRAQRTVRSWWLAALRELVARCVARAGGSLRCASWWLAALRELVARCVARAGGSLRCASWWLAALRELVARCVARAGGSLRCASCRLCGPCALCDESAFSFRFAARYAMPSRLSVWSERACGNSLNRHS